MTATAAAELDAGESQARRNALVLAAASAFGAAAAPITVAISGLAAATLLGPDPALATLPPTTFILGVASGTVPAALLMRRIGRQRGFQCGTGLTMLGGALAAQAMIVGSFWLLCLATAISGAGNAFVQQYRFAAADSAPAHYRPKAISLVMIGGIATGVIGPQVAIHSNHLLESVPFAGAFLAQIGLAAIAFTILFLLRIPAPLPRLPGAHGGRPLSVIVTQPRFVVAAACGVISYGLMSLIMVATPLAMVGHHHHSADDATLGIQWHVIAMYGPSFFTGTLIARFGKEPIIAIGLALILGCGIVALSGYSVAHFWLALVLLGIGWNFGFIGATAMVAETYRPEEQARAQAANDFLIFGFQAVAAISSGLVLTWFGWQALNWLIFPFVALGLILLAWLVLHRGGR